MFPVDDTIVAVASAPGGAARGVIRLSGPGAVDCLGDCFQPASGFHLRHASPTSLVGMLNVAQPIGPLPCRVYLWPTTRSYTRQPTAEIHLLGSPPLLDAALDRFCRSGARLAEPGEFTMRAFLAGRIDLPQAEAVLGVIDATNQRQLQVALNQLAGGLSGMLHESRSRLLNLCADIEAGLDFVEEDVEFVTTEDIVGQLQRISNSLSGALQQIAQRGESHFNVRIVLRGRPNVGKSALWNALVKDASAIISDQPGTTRDYLEGAIEINGFACTLIDTAGVDAGLASELDGAAQAMSKEKHREADLVVLCIDGSSAPQIWDIQQLLHPDMPDVVVLTKCDLPGPVSAPTVSECKTHVDRDTAVLRFAGDDGIKEFKMIPTSCHAGTGLDSLRAALREALERRMNSESSVVALTAARCHESLRRALLDVGRASELALGRMGDELVAAEIRNAMNELGKVVGAVYTEDVLDRIFSRFCIGK